MSKGKRKASKAQEKMSLQDKYIIIADMINRSATQDVTRLFPKTFKIILEGTTRLPIEVMENNEVRFVTIDYIAYEVIAYTANILGDARYHLDYKQAVTCVKTWLSLAEIIPKPCAVGWADETELTFSRLPWKLEEVKNQSCPNFDEWLKRTSNADAFCQWIGSLFVDESDRQQYVWLYSDGGTGKGAMLRFLRKVFKNGFAARQTPDFGNKHWTSGLLGKRLVAFPDCNNSKFITSGLFKSLTGDDPVEMDFKNKDIFTADLNCKYIFLSNHKPDLTHSHADIRRIILCEMQALSEKKVTARLPPVTAGYRQVTASYEDLLWLEGGAFLHKCIELYKEKRSDDSPYIAVETDGVQDILDMKYEDFDIIFENNFELDKDEWMATCTFFNHTSFTYWDDKKRKEFRAYMLKKYGIKRGVKKENGKSLKVYFGIKLRTC